MRYWLLILTVITLSKGTAQQQYKKMFSFVNENDVYLFQQKDGYYTNGLFFTYDVASVTEGQKQVDRFELGQLMYTSNNKRAAMDGDGNIDRPFCGYLYAKYTKDKCITTDALLSYSTSLGVTGKWSLAQQLQQSYHKLIHVKPYPYWETQVPNAVGVNAAASYKTTLLTMLHIVKVVPEIEANMGNFFTNAKAGAYICIGAFEKNDRTALFNTNISSNKQKSSHKYELMFYFNPQLTIQAYNATIQGTLLYATKGAVVARPRTFVYRQVSGILFSKDRVSAKAELVFSTKEANTQLSNQRYGGIHLAYRFN